MLDFGLHPWKRRKIKSKGSHIIEEIKIGGRYKKTVPARRVKKSGLTSSMDE